MTLWSAAPACNYASRMGPTLSIASILEDRDVNEDIVRKAGFGKEVDRVKVGKCPLCNEIVDTSKFKDEISMKEFNISGICQVCQDETFNDDLDDL